MTLVVLKILSYITMKILILYFFKNYQHIEKLKKSVLVRQWRYGSIIFNFVKMNRVAFNSTPLSLLWLMFCAMINASDPTFHLFCGFKYPPSCFCVCWKMKMQIRSMKQVNFVNSSIHYSGLKYPPSCFSVYLENKNAYLKQETSEIVL